MKERPILFSAPMVRAILDGRKTQTRRVMKVQPGDVLWRSNGRDWLWLDNDDGPLTEPAPCIRCPFGAVGDRLWVRETWRSERRNDGARMVRFNADNSVEERPSAHEAPYDTVWRRGLTDRWRPSIHMPRWASRITLEVTGVRVERLQDISEDDAKAEGVSGPFDALFTPKVRFEALWESINGLDAWDANPWVWVVEFRRL